MTSLPEQHIPSVLTPLIKQAVVLQNRAFCYYYPHIFHLTLDDSNLITIRKRSWNWKLIPWVVSLIVITGLIGGGSCVYVCISHIFDFRNTPWVKISLVNVFILAGLGTAAIVEIGTCIQLLMHPQVLMAFNELVKLENQCIQHIPVENGILCKKDHLGMLLNISAVFIATIPVFFVMAAIATDLDPFYFIFEELLPHPYERTLKTILIPPLIRFILGFLCVIEFLRFGFMFIFALILTPYITVSLARLLKKVFGEKCLLFYVRLCIIFSIADSKLSLIAFVGIFLGQAACVLAFWMILNCWEYLSPYILGGITLLLIYLVMFSIILLSTTAEILIETNSLIRCKIDFHSEKKYKGSKYYYKVWKSQRQIYISCGSFFRVEKGAVMAYMQELVNNTMNAVLLIKP